MAKNGRWYRLALEVKHTTAYYLRRVAKHTAIPQRWSRAAAGRNGEEARTALPADLVALVKRATLLREQGRENEITVDHHAASHDRTTPISTRSPIQPCASQSRNWTNFWMQSDQVSYRYCPLSGALSNYSLRGLS